MLDVLEVPRPSCALVDLVEKIRFAGIKDSLGEIGFSGDTIERSGSSVALSAGYDSRCVARGHRLDTAAASGGGCGVGSTLVVRKGLVGCTESHVGHAAVGEALWVLWRNRAIHVVDDIWWLSR